MKWIVETDVFEEGYLEEMEGVFLNTDIPYEIIKYIPFAEPTYLPIIPDNKAIVYGSINLLKQVQKHTHWVPGAATDWDRYKCSNYYPFFEKWLLNSDAVFIPLNRVADYMKKIDIPMFIRPDDGDKAWVGGIYDPYEAERHAEYVMDRHSPLMLMCVATPKKIHREWRVFVVNNTIITGSQYRLKNRQELVKLGDEEKPHNREQIESLIVEMLSESYYRPGEVFAFDIVKSKDQFYLLELSAFNCAGLYGCDIEKLIRAVHFHYTRKRFWA